jgi:hypothetical protein
MHIYTLRAASRPSLQVRGGRASTARADIQIAKALSFFLHRRKAAPSPLFQLPSRRILRMQKDLPYGNGPLRALIERSIAAA